MPQTKRLLIKQSRLDSKQKGRAKFIIPDERADVVTSRSGSRVVRQLTGEFKSLENQWLTHLA